MRFSFALLLVAMLAVAGCGSGSSTAQKPPAQSVDNYPLDTCIVSGQKLGTMGEPFIVKFKGRTVKFCCSSCLKDFNKDSSKYMAILEDAEKKPATPN